jgi:hypothetical protein
MIQMEIGFNLLYLLTIYLITGLMIRMYFSPVIEKQPGAGAFLMAFVLLALGDTGHVGFRLVAYARGGLDQNEVLVGLGALATAVMITVFYCLMMEVWRKQTSRDRNWLFWLVLFLAVVRLGVMTLPDNDWGQVVPPFKYSLIRNSFLTAMGIIVIIAFLVDGIPGRNRFLVNSGIAVICSFVFYIPVVLFIQKVPVLGMLMIPKTIAYVVLAVIGYRRLFLRKD